MIWFGDISLDPGDPATIAAAVAIAVALVIVILLVATVRAAGRSAQAAAPLAQQMGHLAQSVNALTKGKSNCAAVCKPCPTRRRWRRRR